MSLRDLRPLLAIAMIALVASFTQTHAGVSADWLLLFPVLVLVVPLLLGRYLGEEKLRRLAVGRRSAPRRAATVRLRLPRPQLTATAGGLLLAERLAGRAPPIAV